MINIAEALTDGVVLLDGAMATELESRGVDTSTALWSAVAMMTDPDAVRAVHASYFDAGARVATTNSYQANVPAYEAIGLDERQALGLIAESGRLALAARDAHVAGSGGAASAFVAGSIGPYGAFLADGSEYTGAYALSREEFADFHRPRIRALADVGIDLFAVETQPSLAEVKAIVGLLAAEFPTATAWVSFQLRDSETLADGTPLADAARWLDVAPNVVAIGVNCVAPELVTPALAVLGSVTRRPLVCYPNSGDAYDPTTKTWRVAPRDSRFTAHVGEWVDAGARLIGGCCRTSPSDIAVVHEHVGSQDEEA